MQAKTLVIQAQQAELDPLHPHKSRREKKTPRNSLLISTCVWTVDVYIQTYIYHITIIDII